MNMKKEKIAVFGGSFNPVHNGHIALAKHAMDALSLDRVLFVVDRIPPHKTLAEGATDTQRVEMLRLALADEPRFCVETLELEREGTSYTVDTLTQLHAREPNAEFYFLMGSDMLLSFDTWRKPEEISKLATLVCTVREGQSGGEEQKAIALREQFGARIILLEQVSPLSSTEIRNRIHDARPITGLVHAAQEHYIYRNGCYEPQILMPMYARLQNEISAHRMDHTAYVMQTAISFAERFGVDPTKARLAALLHDCAKGFSDARLLSYADTEPPILPVLHAPAGADYAHTVYGVDDDDVLNAIRLHTTGDAHMTDLEKVVYLADMVEPSRDYDGIDEIRNADDLNTMMRLALLRSIWYIKERNYDVHPATLRALEDLGGN